MALMAFRDCQIFIGVGKKDPCEKRVRAKVDLRENDAGRKCCQVFTNTACNSMKTRNLAFKKFGRKYVKIFADGIAVSEKIATFATH